MKYCPYCGSELLEDDILFCPECGKKLSQKEKQGVPEPKLEKQPKESSKLRQKKNKDPAVMVQQPESDPVDNSFEMDEGYDGYYDDVCPSDEGGQQEGIDKEIVKKVLLIAAGVVLIIGICVAFLCLI